MKCIIAGSRTATVEQVIKALELCPFTEDITEVVSGCARGADSYGELIAEEYNISVKKFPAQWNVYGRGAGYIRNAEMAEYADSLVLVWDGSSTGSSSMLELAKKNKMKTFVYNISTKKTEQFNFDV